MMHRLRSLELQRGTVLITVMLMVAVAALIASEIAYRQHIDILRTGAFLARDAASHYLVAAEELGLFALHKDREEDDRKFRSGNQTEIRDHLGEEWNKGGKFPLPGGIGTIEGNLYDLQARFNVNSLMDKDPKRRQIYANTFTAILDKVLREHPKAFPEGTTSNMLRERVIDWLDQDETATGFDGMEDDAYFRKERPYRTANQFISDASELLLIEGITPQALVYLEEELSFLPLSAKINLYTADAELLAQMGLQRAQVDEFVNKQRPRQFNQKFTVEYKDLNEVFTFLKGTTAPPPNPVGGAGQIPNPLDPDNPTPGTTGGAGTGPDVDMFDIKSEFFLLKGKAVVNGKPVLVESVIWKPPLNSAGAAGSGAGAGAGANPNNQNQTQDIPVTTILRKFVDPLKQTN